MSVDHVSETFSFDAMAASEDSTLGEGVALTNSLQELAPLQIITGLWKP